jgi:tRNA (guanine26-N2/guanine27-N2)-dimethyltransferase
MTEANLQTDFPTETIIEGKAKLVVPKLEAFRKSPSDYAPSKAPVFYNPVMELSRDIAILALQAYQFMVGHELSICEPLTGCGVRAIRYALEVEGVKSVIINDISFRAVQLASYNVQLNGLQVFTTVQNKDANLLLSSYASPRKRFDVVDIDPFGSPVPYASSAVRAVRNNGLIALTATDLAPLCGVHPKACVRKYGGKPLRTEYCHELALRLLAGSLVTTAAKQNIGANVVFGHSTDHYVRLYATIKYSAKKADESMKNMGYITHCFKCLHRQPEKGMFEIWHSQKCSQCGSKVDAAGPLWLGKLFDKEFVVRMELEAEHKVLRHKERIRKMLGIIKSEADAPITYYVIDELCGKLALPVPSIQRVIDGLKERGFEACKTHFSSKAIRTNAPVDIVKESLQKAYCFSKTQAKGNAKE